MLVIRSAGLRRLFGILIPFVLIPAAVAAGIFVFEEKRYALVSLAVVILTLALFVTGFEKKRTGTRRLIIASVMTALSAAGRFIPLFKPVTALTIISAMYLGPEAGFLVGSLSAVISNFYFGQGPWTPFQMFSWGIIGLAAGFAASGLKKSRVRLCVFGALSGLLFSLIMDVWTVLWYDRGFSAAAYAAALAAAAPYAALYSVSNVIFLLLCAKPFGEKLERIRIKYGV